MNTKTTKTSEQIIQNLADKANNVAKEAEELMRQIRIARGTRDLTPVPAPTYVGDEGPTGELLEAVRRLVTERPQMHQDLLQATGARADRIKGVLMRIQREDDSRLVNLGTETRALWFIPDGETLKRLRRIR